MQVVNFAARAALVVALLAVQAYLLTQVDFMAGVGLDLLHQSMLQAAVLFVAPTGYRFVCTAVAGWVAVLMAVVLVPAWMTVVVPLFLLIGGIKNGDPGPFLVLVGVTAYLAFPLVMSYVAYLLDDD